MKLNAQQLRTVSEQEAQTKLKSLKRRPIYFILENIYDTYNIGGLFRLADALAIEKIYLCGEMETPPNHKIKKASIGTYKIVPWIYTNTVKEAIDDIKDGSAKILSRLNSSLPLLKQKVSKNFTSPFLNIVAVEQHDNSVDYRNANYSQPLALIFGNETFGILPATLKLADQIVEIPMWGINKSLNVIVSAAIVGYWAVSKLSLE